MCDQVELWENMTDRCVEIGIPSSYTSILENMELATNQVLKIMTEIYVEKIRHPICGLILEL